MDAIRSWVMTICLAAVAAGMAGILAPSGNLEKIYKFVISLFFLACVLVPVFNLRKIELPNPAAAAPQCQNEDAVQAVVSEQAAEAAREKMTELVKTCCENLGVEPVSVQVTMGAGSSESNAVRCRIVLKGGDMGRQNEIVSLIKAQLGFDTQITSSQGDGSSP